LTDSGPALEVLDVAGDGDQDQIPIVELPLGQSVVPISAPGNVTDPVIICDDPIDERPVADETSIQEPINTSSESFVVPTELTCSAGDQTSGKN